MIKQEKPSTVVLSAGCHVLRCAFPLLCFLEHEGLLPADRLPFNPFSFGGSPHVFLLFPGVSCMCYAGPLLGVPGWMTLRVSLWLEGMMQAEESSGPLTLQARYKYPCVSSTAGKGKKAVKLSCW